jgi:hypothetical protein
MKIGVDCRLCIHVDLMFLRFDFWSISLDVLFNFDLFVQLQVLN